MENNKEKLIKAFKKAVEDVRNISDIYISDCFIRVNYYLNGVQHEIIISPTLFFSYNMNFNGFIRCKINRKTYRDLYIYAKTKYDSLANKELNKFLNNEK